jgi:hypothetical protein
MGSKSPRKSTRAQRRKLRQKPAPYLNETIPLARIRDQLSVVRGVVQAVVGALANDETYSPIATALNECCLYKLIEVDTALARRGELPP